ncbi:MAG: cysteine desulfurase family protein [Pirellulales bacterium]
MRTIYLDYNATTPLAPAVREAMQPYLDDRYGDPSSAHALGRACQEALSDARLRVAQLLGGQRDQIVFTSGGTESNNLAVKGVALQHAPAAGGHIVISAIEHPAVTEPARFLERLGYGLSIVGCDRRGVVDPRAVAATLRPDTVLVSVIHANHEIGVVQPIRQIAAICRERDILCHTDASQTVGKLPVSVDELGVDLLSLSGHKFHGPKGAGALYVRRGVGLEPLLHGTGQVAGLRAGTENVAAIVGLGRAAAMAARNLNDTVDRIARLRDRLHERLHEALGGRLAIIGSGADRLPNTLAVSVASGDAREILRRCPEVCASAESVGLGAMRISPTLAAMGISADIARGTLRLSLGWFTTEEEIDRAGSLLAAACELD